MPTIVQKFGGTSVADPQRIMRCAARVVEARNAGNRVVVVVSARPRSISHNAALDQLPRRLDKQYPEISLIMVYPAAAPVAEDILELA